jgi:hypothetical protein
MAQPIKKQPLWYEFSSRNGIDCLWCGNSGFIKTAEGKKPCICPNGRFKKKERRKFDKEQGVVS